MKGEVGAVTVAGRVSVPSGVWIGEEGDCNHEIHEIHGIEGFLNIALTGLRPSPVAQGTYASASLRQHTG